MIFRTKILNQIQGGFGSGILDLNKSHAYVTQNLNPILSYSGQIRIHVHLLKSNLNPYSDLAFPIRFGFQLQFCIDLI